MFPSSLIDEITETVAELAATDRDGWSDAARNDELRAVLAARERFEAAILELIAQWDGRGSWGERRHRPRAKAGCGPIVAWAAPRWVV